MAEHPHKQVFKYRGNFGYDEIVCKETFSVQKPFSQNFVQMPSLVIKKKKIVTCKNKSFICSNMDINSMPHI